MKARDVRGIWVPAVLNSCTSAKLRGFVAELGSWGLMITVHCEVHEPVVACHLPSLPHVVVIDPVKPSTHAAVQVAPPGDLLQTEPLGHVAAAVSKLGSVVLAHPA